MTDSTEITTRKGTATFEKNKVVFDENNIQYIKNLYKSYWERGSTASKVLFIISAFGFVSSVFYLLSQLPRSLPQVASALVAVLSLYFIVLLVQKRYRGFTSDKEVEIESINSSTAIKGSKGVTRPRIILEYEEEDVSKKRYIMMPSLFTSKGGEEYEKTKNVLKERGINLEEG